MSTYPSSPITATCARGATQGLPAAIRRTGNPCSRNPKGRADKRHAVVSGDRASKAAKIMSRSSRKLTGMKSAAPSTVAKLQLNPDGSLIQLNAGDWFLCFVPGIKKQWWHPFVHKRHKHVFAMRPAENGNWTLFEPWWTRLLTATITSDQARKFLQWGAMGDVLLVREAIPGRGGQIRGWMSCAALATYLLGRPYWVWTPHALYRRLLREPKVCRIDVSELLSRDLSKLGTTGSRRVAACEECRPVHPRRRRGTAKPFCMNCGRDLVEIPAVREG